jgi:hypothetical protein
MMDTKLKELLREVAFKCGISEGALIAGELAYLHKHRKAHPDGTFDRAGRFTLSERFTCCTQIRSPSIAFPHTELTHGRTDKPLATRFGVPQKMAQKIRETFEIVEAVSVSQLSRHLLTALAGEMRKKLAPFVPAKGAKNTIRLWLDVRLRRASNL